MCCKAGPEPSDPPASFTFLSGQDCRHTSVSTCLMQFNECRSDFLGEIKQYQTIFKNYCEKSVVTSIQDNNGSEHTTLLSLFHIKSRGHFKTHAQFNSSLGDRGRWTGSVSSKPTWSTNVDFRITRIM